jgi:hypothetical protein
VSSRCPVSLCGIGVDVTRFYVDPAWPVFGRVYWGRFSTSRLLIRLAPLSLRHLREFSADLAWAKGKPAGVTGGLLFTQQKAATAGHCGGDGFSQYETTDVPMWPVPRPKSHTKKAAAGDQRRLSERRTVTTRRSPRS